MAMLPVYLPESFIVTGEGLPRALFGEQQHDTGMPNELPLPRRYVEQFGSCEVCSMHCPIFTEPQPARLFDRTCALCFQFDRTRNAARRLRANTIHYYNVMRQLEHMEQSASALVEHDPGLLQPVVPSPVLWNRHSIPVRPPLTSTPASTYSDSLSTGDWPPLMSRPGSTADPQTTGFAAYC